MVRILQMQKKTDTLPIRPVNIGFVHAIIEPYLLKMKEVGLPAWPEALDERATRFMRTLAFELWRLLWGRGSLMRRAIGSIEKKESWYMA